MADLIGKYRSADVVVFATPLHNDNVSGILKDFIDRLLPTADPHFEKDPAGEVRHVHGTETAPKFVMIANSGFPEQSHFQVLRLLARRMARNYRTEFIGEIYRGAGSLLQESEMAPFVDPYRALLRAAGSELVRVGRISEETSRQLEQPLIPAPGFIDLYISQANAYMDRMIADARKG
jgi:multimeric flavodoxin WrbA